MSGWPALRGTSDQPSATRGRYAPRDSILISDDDPPSDIDSLAHDAMCFLGKLFLIAVLAVLVVAGFGYEFLIS